MTNKDESRNLTMLWDAWRVGNCNREIQITMDDAQKPYKVSEVWNESGRVYRIVDEKVDDRIDYLNYSVIAQAVSVELDLFYHDFSRCSWEHFKEFLAKRHESIIVEASEMIMAGYSTERVSTYYLDYWEMSAQTLYNNKYMSHHEFVKAVTAINDELTREERLFGWELPELG